MATRKSSSKPALAAIAAPQFQPRIGRARGYVAGVRVATAMLRRLEKSITLAEACDIGFDDESVLRPQLNIVELHVQALVAQGDPQKLEGFCAILSGFIGASVAGCVIEARDMQNMMRKRMAGAVALAQARGDDTFQSFLSGAGCAAPA